jgi:hypothetical protein
MKGISADEIFATFAFCAAAVVFTPYFIDAITLFLLSL